MTTTPAANTENGPNGDITPVSILQDIKTDTTTEYCEDRLWEFKVMTEVELGIK